MAIIYQHQDKIIGCNIVTSEEENKKEDLKKTKQKHIALVMGLNFQGLLAKEEKKQINPKLICPRAFV